MRVMLLNPAFSGGGYMHALANALADAGAEVDLVTGPHYTATARHWARTAYRPVVRFNRWTLERSWRPGPLRPLWRALRLVGHCWGMARVALESPRYDVVHVHFTPVPILDRWFYRWIARRGTLVYTVHNLLPHDAARDPALVARFRDIHNTAHRLIAHTRATVDGLGTLFGIAPDAVSRVPMGNANHLRDLRGVPDAAQLGLTGDPRPLILLLGEVRHNKGIDTLLRAASLLRDSGVPFRLLFVGKEGVPATPYRALAHELGLDGQTVWRLEYVPEEEVPAYFAAATVVAVPYRLIDQSLVLISAISLGKAVVATRIAGLEEVVRESGAGELVEVDDAPAMADALRRLLTDDARRAAAEAAALRHADGALSWAPLARLTLDVYRLAQRTKRRAASTTSDTPK